MIVPTPQLVGTPVVCDLFSVLRRQVYARLAADDPLVNAGYLGKIANRHTWNLHELCAGLFTSDVALEDVIGRLTDRGDADPLDTMLCAAPGCDRIEQTLGLCALHLHRLMTAWRHAPRSSVVVMQLVAMCRWVVDRNEHLVLPEGFDPWSTVCMTPGCGNETNTNGWHGPLCTSCSSTFWQNAPGREWPAHWKRAKGAA